MRARLLRVVLASSFICAEALGQPLRQPAPQLFELRGRIVAATTGDPLPRARIAAADAEDLVDVVFSDDGGRFAIVLRSISSVTLAITKAGYAATHVHATRRDVSSGVLADVRLESGAAISGRVVDGSGAPAVGTTVVARRRAARAADAAPVQRFTETDDRGEYRIGGLAEGQYTVVAGSSSPSGTSSAVDETPPQRESDRRKSRARQPRTASLVKVDVKAGDELTSVNLALEPVRVRSQNDEAREPVLSGERLVGRAALEGRMVAESGEPLEGGTVVLLRQNNAVRRATADANGRFLFRDVQAGRYTLHAWKPGYVNVQYGQRRATESGRTIRLRDDDTLRGLQLMLPRGSAVVGTVMDEHGEPIEGATVRALQVRSVNGRRMAFGVPDVRDRRSDDRGQYRLFGLLPGAYLISAFVDAAVSSPGRGDKYGYAPSFYPAAAEIRDAWPLQVDVQRDVFGAHIVLVRSRAVRVSGVVFDSQGKPLNGTVFLATSQRSRGIALEPRIVAVRGGFLLTNVTPGDYVIQATRDQEGNRPPEFAFQFLTVSEVDPAPVFLMTAPATTLEGHIFIDGQASRDFGALMALAPVPADLDRAPRKSLGTAITLHGEGAFRMPGMAGPMRFALVGTPPGWYLKSIVVNGREATDVPYDFGVGFMQSAEARINISTAGASIYGQVTDERSKSVSEYTVVAFPTDRRKWITHSRYLKVARPAQDDSFEVTGLPPGEYWVAAADTVEASLGTEWQDPEMLDKLAVAARRVTVGEGDLANVTLSLFRR